MNQHENPLNVLLALYCLTTLACSMPRAAGSGSSSFRSELMPVAEHLQEQRVKDFFSGSIWQFPRTDGVNYYHRFDSTKGYMIFYYDVGDNDYENHNSFTLESVHQDKKSGHLYWKARHRHYMTPETEYPVVLYFPEADSSSMGPYFMWEALFDSEGNIVFDSGDIFWNKPALINPD